MPGELHCPRCGERVRPPRCSNCDRLLGGDSRDQDSLTDYQEASQ